MYSNDQLNDALQICMEFGPDRSIPPAARIVARLPALTPSDIRKIEELHEKLIQRATDLGQKVVDARLTHNQAAKRLGELFPTLTEDAVSRALSQGCWFAAK